VLRARVGLEDLRAEFQWEELLRPVCVIPFARRQRRKKSVVFPRRGAF
jgi:hypothetical protein